MRKTKILCTLGPSSDSVEVLQNMIRSGMNLARLNMAHGDLHDQAARIRMVRQAAEELGAIVPILLDVKGPEIRLGKLKEPAYVLRAGDEIILTTEQVVGDARRVSVTYREMADVVVPGSTVLIDDGLMELKVLRVSGEEIVCTIVNGGELKPRKGVNLPGIRTTLPGITDRDVAHIRFGIECGVDIIAVSFVRKAEDILEVRRLLAENNAEHIAIISKIENEEGVGNLDAILEVSDGIMVARGDLGVEIPMEEVPIIQREIIEKCNRAGKSAIVATHMLESMQVNPRPTRAEVSDVANAVLQGADMVMLSGETAAGRYPVESVAAMCSIALRMEGTIDHKAEFAKRRFAHASDVNVTDTVIEAAVNASLELGAKALITPTESGFTARMAAKYRPQAPILAITLNDAVMKRLTMHHGVVPLKRGRVRSTDDMFAAALEHGRSTGLLAPGDFVVITAGIPSGRTGATNLIKIVQVED